MTLPPFLVVALSGMEDAIRQAGAAVLLVWVGVVLWIGFVLLLDELGII